MQQIAQVFDNFRHVELGRFPSPLYLDQSLLDGKSSSDIKLLIKHDGLCSDDYAGNKVRKLEYLLAEAIDQNAHHVVTLGSAGSNHAVATSTYARRLGMKCTVCMVDQTPSDIARKNLLHHVQLGTHLKMFKRLSLATQYAHDLCRSHDYYLVPLGGSSPLACVGFIRAIQELKQQLEYEELPTPHRIYVASGTMGTAVGLAIGVRLFRLPSEIVAVRVTERSVANPSLFGHLYHSTVNYLRENSANKFNGQIDNFDHVHFEERFFGTAYAEPTDAALDAIKRARDSGLELEGTYTGKALSALIAHAQSGELKGQTVLFWNTLNAVSVPKSLNREAEKLGPDFAKYFHGFQ